MTRDEIAKYFMNDEGFLIGTYEGIDKLLEACIVYEKAQVLAN